MLKEITACKAKCRPAKRIGTNKERDQREGWITLGRTSGYGKQGNADVFRVRIEDGVVVRKENLTKSALWDSAPDWSTHPPVG